MARRCSAEGLSWRFAPWATSLEEHYVTSIDRADNPFWGLFEDACAAGGVKVEHEIFPAGTDSQFLRALGVAAIGFSPLRCTPTLLHEHDEALAIDSFLEGIGVYERIITALAGAERQATEQRAADEPPSKKART